MSNHLTITIEPLEGDHAEHTQAAYQIGREAARLEKAFTHALPTSPIQQRIRNLRRIEGALLEALITSARTFKVIGVDKSDRNVRREKPNKATDYKTNLFTQDEADAYVERNESPDNSETYEIEVAS